LTLFVEDLALTCQAGREPLDSDNHSLRLLSSLTQTILLMTASPSQLPILPALQSRADVEIIQSLEKGKIANFSEDYSWHSKFIQWVRAAGRCGEALTVRLL
jgi:hypothetical protein